MATAAKICAECGQPRADYAHPPPGHKMPTGLRWACSEFHNFVPKKD